MNIFDVLRAAKSRRIDSSEALPGRDTPLPVAQHHAVLGSPMAGPFPADTETLYVAMGCFWGAEELYWRVPGVYTTAVGYQGGFTPNPTYSEVCTGMTGHAESVLVAYNPAQVGVTDLLRLFWEHHDPTQGMRQGNDIGSQYRSAIFTTTPEQWRAAHDTKRLYDEVLRRDGWDPITTTIETASDHPFYYAEPDHQQYLHKVPNGYRCHSNTGVALPALA